MQSHAGLFNLCIVVLVAVNSRLIIENLMKVCVPLSSGNFSWMVTTTVYLCMSMYLYALIDYANVFPFSYFYLLILYYYCSMVG